MRTILLSALLTLLLVVPASADSLVYVSGGNVWVAEPDGTAARPLTTDGTPQVPYGSPSQADDGTTMAVRGSRLYRIDRQGNKTALNSLLTDKPGSIGAIGPLDARISPDGTKVAYWLGIMGGWYDYATHTHWTRPESTVVVQNAVDGTPLGTTMFFEEPSWTADGQLLVFDAHNGGVPQVYSGPPGTNHNALTPWFHDRDTFDTGGLWRPIGAGELKHGRLATLRAGGTMGEGYEARMRFNSIQLYRAPDRTTPPVPDCTLADSEGVEFASPTWSPNADALAWATPAGIYSTPLGANCAGFVERLVIPGGREPDWGPAAPGQAAPVAAPPAAVPPAAKPAPPTVAVKTRGKRITITCACAIKAVARKGKRVVGRAKGSGKVTLKVRARGKVKLTVTAGGATTVRTVRVR